MVNPIDIDSNDVIVSFAEEVVGSIGSLSSPTWYAREPNNTADIGGDPSLTSRSPLGTRKRLSGSIVGIDAKAGWNEDFTQNNWVRALQGVFCADVAGEISTLGINTAAIPITSVAAADNSYNAASGLAVFLASVLVLASGFALAANNGVRKIVTTAAGKVTVTGGTLVNEASPPATAKLEVIGVQGAAGDITINAAGTIGATALNFTTLPIVVGQWIFVGGDDPTNKFATTSQQGYARISAITATLLTFDKSTFVFATDAGAAKKIQLYFGRYFRDPATNKVRTYTVERKLGNDGVGIQTEYVTGGFANEWTLSVPKKEKLNADISMIGIDYSQQTGTVGPKAGTRAAALGEQALNSSSDVYRAVIGPASTNAAINPTAYFGYFTDGTIKISNNADVNEAVGSSVGFDINVGEFDAVAQVNAYFSTIGLQQAIRNHASAGLDFIIGRNNAGWIFDIPLAELSGGINKPEKNKPVMVPVTVTGILNANGYVAHMQEFVYLPAAAMPVINQGFAVSLGGVT